METTGCSPEDLSGYHPCIYRSGRQTVYPANTAKLSDCTFDSFKGRILTLSQIIVTTILYFGSYRFHASYGFFSEHVNPWKCRRGLEWIPTVFWQAIWTFFVGPYVLFKTRNIHDIHYWALQTRLAIGMR